MRRTSKEPRRAAAGDESSEVGPALLRRFPLPIPDQDGDKEARGRVLVVGGSRETPGAVILAGLAALRAGAGKLRLAVPAGGAPGIATAIPEARVLGLPENTEREIDAEAVDELIRLVRQVDCVLLGPGILDEDRAAAFLPKVFRQISGGTVIVDAGALGALAKEPQALAGWEGRAVITPHHGEMANLLGCEKGEVTRAARETACRAAALFQSVVVLKGSETFIAAPGGECYVNRAGNVGLATCGSGDTLAGIIAGMAARGSEPLAAALWGVHLHARAGDELARRIGPLGYLAREITDEIPRLMDRFSRGS